MDSRLLCKRNILMICLFCDIDRRNLLTALRQLKRKQRERVLCGLLADATRW